MAGRSNTKGHKLDEKVKNEETSCICCEEHHIHPERIKEAITSVPDEGELSDLAELFKVFGDVTRLRILFVLFKSELCVCDIAESLDMTQSAISHQLKVLKQIKLVKARREGKSIFYSLSDNHVASIIAQGLEHVDE